MKRLQHYVLMPTKEEEYLSYFERLFDEALQGEKFGHVAVELNRISNEEQLILVLPHFYNSWQFDRLNDYMHVIGVEEFTMYSIKRENIEQLPGEIVITEITDIFHETHKSFSDKEFSFESHVSEIELDSNTSISDPPVFSESEEIELVMEDQGEESISNMVQTLKIEINKHLDICDSGLTPIICKARGSDKGRESLIVLILNKIISEGLSISQSITEVELMFNDNKIEA